MRTPPSCSSRRAGAVGSARIPSSLVHCTYTHHHHQITHSHSQSVMLVMRWGSSTRSRSSRRSSSLDLRDSLIAPPTRSDKKCPSWNCLKCASGAGPDRAAERAYLPLWELSSGTPREKRRLGYDVIRPAANQKTARYRNCSATYN
jgi:hypothetical protein